MCCLWRIGVTMAWKKRGRKAGRQAQMMPAHSSAIDQMAASALLKVKSSGKTMNLNRTIDIEHALVGVISKSP